MSGTGLPHDYVAGIVEDTAQNLWLATVLEFIASVTVPPKINGGSANTTLLVN